MAYDEFTLIVNFFVGLGTILLAILAFVNIKITQKQLKSFQDQTKIFLSQNLPILKFDTFCFRENTLIIYLTNLGTRPAFEIGCSSICLSVKQVQEKKNMEWLYNFEWPNVTKDDIKDYFDIENKQKLVISNEVLFGQTILLEVEPEYTITFLKRDNGEAFLNSDERDVRFKCEPVFCLSNLNEKQKELFLKGNPEALRNYQYRKFTFNEIKSIFKQNNTRFVYLSFILFCKDPLENEIFQNDIISCIVDLDVDTTIEDAILKPRKLIRYVMSYPKFVKEMGWQPQWMYKYGKWRSDILQDDNEKKNSQKKAIIRHSR